VLYIFMYTCSINVYIKSMLSFIHCKLGNKQMTYGLEIERYRASDIRSFVPTLLFQCISNLLKKTGVSVYYNTAYILTDISKKVRDILLFSI
jgi:hypothetical protein